MIGCRRCRGIERNAREIGKDREAQQVKENVPNTKQLVKMISLLPRHFCAGTGQFNHLERARPMIHSLSETDRKSNFSVNRVTAWR